jgi:thiol-disulfide isomerase/thioredoxin
VEELALRRENNVAGRVRSAAFFCLPFRLEEDEVHHRSSCCGIAALLLLSVPGCLTRSSTEGVTANTTQPTPDSAASGPAAAPTKLEPNDDAPESAQAVTLEVVDIEGYRQALAKHKGKVVFVDFWATWCPPCMENFPHSVHISRAFPEEVAVMSVSFDELEDKDKALEFLEKQEARFENFITTYGAGTEGTEAFQIDSGVPHYKIYDREGNVAKTLAPGPDLKITLELLDEEIRGVLGK